MNNEQEVWDGDWLVNSDTGEIISHKDENFHVLDMSSAEWVLARLNEAEADVVALETRLASITANMNRMINEKKSRMNWLSIRFGEELRSFAEKKLEGMPTRTIKTPYASMYFRKTQGSIKVANQKAAVEWAETNKPDAIKIEKKVLVTGLKDIKDQLPALIFEITEPEDRFYIETGIRKAQENDGDSQGQGSE